MGGAADQQPPIHIRPYTTTPQLTTDLYTMTVLFVSVQNQTSIEAYWASVLSVILSRDWLRLASLLRPNSTRRTCRWPVVNQSVTRLWHVGKFGNDLDVLTLTWTRQFENCSSAIWVQLSLWRATTCWQIRDKLRESFPTCCGLVHSEQVSHKADFEHYE